MNKKAIWWVVGVVVVVVIIILVVFVGQKPTETGPIKIGIIAALSGDTAVYGEPIKDAVVLAAKQVNDAGGINGRKIELVSEDVACADGKASASAAQKLISVDQVKYIIGFPCSGEVLAAAPISEKAKVILMAQGSSPAISDAGQYIFRTFPNDSLTGVIMAKSIIADGYKKVAVITENTDHPMGILNVFTKELASDSGTLVASESYNPSVSDFRSQLSKIKSQNPDALLINSQTGKNAAVIAKQARDLGMKTQFYTAFFSGPEFVKSGPAVEGAYTFDAPTLSSNNPKASDFLRAFNSMYGQAPVYPFYAGGGYDQFTVLMNAIRAVGADDTDKIKDWLYAMPEYDGVIGKFRFDSTGDVVGVGLRKLQVKSGEVVDVSLTK